jgi:hypothetical protein
MQHRLSQIIGGIVALGSIVLVIIMKTGVAALVSSCLSTGHGLLDNHEAIRFLSQDHELRLPPPRHVTHRLAWDEPRSTWIYHGCQPISHRTADSLTRCHVQFELDVAGVMHLEDHCGRPHQTPLVTSRQLDWITALGNLEGRLAEAYAKHGARYRLDPSRRVVELGFDPAWICRTSVPLLRPVSEAIVRQFPRIQNPKGRRQDVLAIVCAVQSGVPYVSIPDRKATGWESDGVRTPGATVLHGGDCDSKVLLLATLIRAVDPRLPLAEVLLPDHAVLGIGIPALECDATITAQGIEYVLVETTSCWEIGELPEEVRRQQVREVVPIP